MGVRCNSLLPNAENGGLAGGALTVGNAVFADVVADAFDEGLATAGAPGGFGFGVLQVADVDKLETGLDGDFAGAQEGGLGRGRQVLELILREEARKVQRGFDTEVLGHPVAELFSFLFGIVERGDDEIGDFEHHSALLHDRQRLENRREAGVAKGAVEVVGEGFEIDVSGIDIATDFAQRFGADVGGGDEHVFDSSFGSGLATVVGVFVGDERLGVGVGDGGAVSLPGHLGKVFRRDLADGRGKQPGLRNLRILTLRAVQVAADGGDGEDRRAGQKVEQGFLFDGVDIQRAGESVGRANDFTIDVLSHPTVARFAKSEQAPFRADRTSSFCLHPLGRATTGSPDRRRRRSHRLGTISRRLRSPSSYVFRVRCRGNRCRGAPSCFRRVDCCRGCDPCGERSAL